MNEARCAERASRSKITAGEALAEARRRAGLTQESLAEKLECDRSYVSSLERGRRNASPAGRAAFAAALGADGEQLFAGFPPARSRTDPLVTLRGRHSHDGPGERLRQARIARRLTLKELGAIVGAVRGRALDVSWLAKIENGHEVPSGPMALALAEAVEIPDLFSVGPCPCRPACPVLTVDGRYARGHGPYLVEVRRRAGHKNRGRPRPDFGARTKAAHRDPLFRFNLRMARWGYKNVEAAKRAASALEQDLKRRKGGAPAKGELHARWLAMFEAADNEELAIMERYRMVALLDWQERLDDWPRDRWPASGRDPLDLAPHLLAGAAERVRKGLQTVRKKPLLPVIR